MTIVRGDVAPAVVATALTAVLLSGCSPAAESTLTVHREDGQKQTVSVSDLRCVTSSDRFAASSTQDSVGELSPFTVTISAGSDEAITWVSLGDDQWFLTTESFEHGDTVSFDDAEGRIGTSTKGYPTQFDTSATLDGEVSCTVKDDL